MQTPGLRRDNEVLGLAIVPFTAYQAELAGAARKGGRVFPVAWIQHNTGALAEPAGMF